MKVFKKILEYDVTLMWRFVDVCCYGCSENKIAKLIAELDASNIEIAKLTIKFENTDFNFNKFKYLVRLFKA